MRSFAVRVVIGLSSLLTVATQAALNSASFPFVRPVTPPAALHSEIGSFVLDDDLFDALDDRLGNMRLFDSNDHETPFLIRRKAPQQTVDQLVPFRRRSRLSPCRNGRGTGSN